jgi:hypothetical protein
VQIFWDAFNYFGSCSGTDFETTVCQLASQNIIQNISPNALNMVVL